MTSSYLLAQLTDTHIGATWGGADPVARLNAVLASVQQLGTAVDAVVISGDLADNGDDAEYAGLAQVVAELGVPVYAVAGNHDHREGLRRHFDAPGESGAPVQYGVDLGPMRLVVLDTTRPGSDGGELDRPRLQWLDAELAVDAHKPALLVLHHPPLVTGIRAFDEIGLRATDQRALADLVARHPHVCALAGGHVHRTMTGSLAGRPVLAAPSTYVQARLHFGSERLEFVSDPPGFAIHTLLDGELVSHVQLAGA